MQKTPLLAIALVVITATTASAQTPKPLELGMDAGVTIAFGDLDYTSIDIPASAFRVGFPVGTRTSLEPKLGLHVRSGDGDTFTSYRAQLGLLYHLGSRRYPGAYHRAGMYVRPFVGIDGATAGDNDVTSGLLGVGLGVKVPLVSRLSSRFEVNFAHLFGDFDTNEVGLLAGLSFFTR